MEEARSLQMGTLGEATGVASGKRRLIEIRLGAEKMARMTTKRAVSAGGVVFSLRDSAIFVVVCGREGETETWVLPKGAPANREKIEEAAVREVREETGLNVEIVTMLGAIEYWFVGMPERVRYHKIVHHFLMKPTGGDIPHHDWEFDVVKWVPLAQAYRLLSHENEREVLGRAEEAVRKLLASGWKPEPFPIAADKPLECEMEDHPQNTL